MKITTLRGKTLQLIDFHIQKFEFYISKKNGLICKCNQPVFYYQTKNIITEKNILINSNNKKYLKELKLQ